MTLTRIPFLLARFSSSRQEFPDSGHSTPLPPWFVIVPGGSTQEKLCGSESGRDFQEQLLMGVSAGEQEANTPGVAQDHRPDLEQLQTDRRHLRTRQFRALECQAADPLHQYIAVKPRDVIYLFHK